MDATPWAHVLVVALATQCTGDTTVAPGAGEVTVTVAKAGTELIRSANRRWGKVFMDSPRAVNLQKASLGRDVLGWIPYPSGPETNGYEGVGCRIEAWRLGATNIHEALNLLPIAL